MMPKQFSASLLNVYSFFQSHMMHQKSLKYADLLLKKHLLLSSVLNDL